MENMTIGQRIASRRKLANLSQESISEQIGVARQSVSKWESDAGLPDIDNLIALSKIFGVSVGWLLGTEQDPNFDPSLGLSDAQLRMVERVVEGRKPKRLYRYVAAGLAACILVPGVLFAGMFVHLKGENTKAQQQISMLEEQVDVMNEMLLQQKKEKDLLLNVFAQARLNDDGQTVTVDLYFVPKLFQENAQAYFTVRNESNNIWLKLECSPLGEWYRCKVELPLANEYLYSFILANDSGFQEQELNGYESLGYLQNLQDVTGYHLDESAEPRSEWDLKEAVYTFEQPIASPYVQYLKTYVGFKAIDVTLYHNDTPIHTETLRQTFRDFYGPHMVGEEALIPKIRVDLPELSEGDVLRLKITAEDYDGHIITNTLEELTVISSQNVVK